MEWPTDNAAEGVASKFHNNALHNLWSFWIKVVIRRRGKIESLNEGSQNERIYDNVKETRIYQKLILKGNVQFSMFNLSNLYVMWY